MNILAFIFLCFSCSTIAGTFFLLFKFDLPAESASAYFCSLVIGLLIPCAWAAVVCLRRGKGEEKKERVGTIRLRFLETFWWYCSNKSRDDIELVLADLRRDIREMKEERVSEAHIKTVTFWKTCCCVVPILWSALLRILGAILPAGKFIKSLRGWW